MVDAATTLMHALGSALPRTSGDLAVAGACAVLGGAVVRRRYQAGERTPVDAPGGHPVTAADRASQECIVGTLAELRPGEAVRSEEGIGPGPARETGRVWIVDPLDGTREFVNGIEEFSVMTALAVDGEARQGAVYLPVPDRLYLGDVDAGSWRIEGAGGAVEITPHPVRARARASGPLRIVGSRSHRDARLVELVERMEEAGIACEVRPSGSAGIKCAIVAGGEADLYIHPVPHLREWDTCAGEAVARGAGAVVTDCAGQLLRYGKPDPRQPGGIFVAAPGIEDIVRPFLSAPQEN